MPPEPTSVRRAPQRANPFGPKVPWVMLNQETAIGYVCDLPHYLRLYFFALGRVDHVGHAHLLPAEASEQLGVGSSQISRAIKKLEAERLLCEGSIPTCLLVPQDHVVRRNVGRTKSTWQCPRLPDDPAYHREALLSPGLLALRSVPLAGLRGSA
jgi:hypothetical protein